MPSVTDTRSGASQASRAAVVSALRRGGPATRQGLIEQTGISRATISATLRTLLADGLIREAETVPGAGRGRPAMLIELDPTRAELIGLEIGRAHVAAAVADGADTVIAQADIDVPAEDAIAVRTAAALELLEQVADERGVDLTGVQAVAVGTPGPKFRGGEHSSPDLALTRYSHERAMVASQVADRFRCLVETDNNTRYMALGEARSGAAAGARDVVYLRVDEGVGGGVVADGALLSGHWGAAGEIGHVSVDPAGPRCPCGGRGCVELAASLPALLRATGTGTPAALAEAAAEPANAAALRAAAEAVAHALAAVITSVNTSVVVLGGRVAGLPGFRDHVGTALRDQVPSWCAAELSVRAPADDRAAGARGALVRARQCTESGPDRLLRAGNSRTAG